MLYRQDDAFPHARQGVAVIRVIWSILLAGWFVPGAVEAGPLRICTKFEAVRLSEKLGGDLLDFTFNHRVDRRIYSPALDEKRDIYVYIPPKFDASKRYPVMFWLHGFNQDEKDFMEVAPLFDAAILRGDLPPMIIVAPDGTINGRPSLFNTGSFYIDSNAGRFGDYLSTDVWNFAVENFPIRPDRESHILAGPSMGGFGAYNAGFKHRDRFGVLVGIFPPINLCYNDCRDNYFGDFDPNCTKHVERLKPHAPIGRFYGGLVTVRQRRIIQPLFGRTSADVVERVSAENPIEMLESRDIKPGEFKMYLCYGKRDEFNIDAQCESFIDVAVKRGLTITYQVDPDGQHNSRSGRKLLPGVISWLDLQLRDLPATPQ